MKKETTKQALEALLRDTTWYDCESSPLGGHMEKAENQTEDMGSYIAVEDIETIIKQINKQEHEVLSKEDLEEWASGELEVPTRHCPACNKVKKLYNLDNSVCPHTNLLRLSMDTFECECKDCGALVTPENKVGMVIKSDSDDFSKLEVYTL